MRPRDLEWSDVGPWPSIDEEPPRPTPSPPPCSRPADEPNDSKPATAKEGVSRATLLAELGEVLERLGDDEIAVLHLVATRVLAGQAMYGHLSVASDGRDFVREALEEACDGCFYIAVSLLRGRRRRGGTSRRPSRG